MLLGQNARKALNRKWIGYRWY